MPLLLTRTSVQPGRKGPRTARALGAQQVEGGAAAGVLLRLHRVQIVAGARLLLREPQRLQLQGLCRTPGVQSNSVQKQLMQVFSGN